MAELGEHKFKQGCTVWAMRVSFKFQVEGKDGGKVDKSGLRPFGDEYISDRSGDTYTYTFDLRSPEIVGLDLRDFLKLTVYGVPDNLLADTALAGDRSWVTDKALWPSTDVERLKSGKE